MREEQGQQRLMHWGEERANARGESRPWRSGDARWRYDLSLCHEAGGRDEILRRVRDDGEEGKGAERNGQDLLLRYAAKRVGNRRASGRERSGRCGEGRQEGRSGRMALLEWRIQWACEEESEREREGLARGEGRQWAWKSRKGP